MNLANLVKIRSQMWSQNPFNNSVKIVVPRGFDNVTRKMIFNAFQTLIGDQVKHIHCISPCRTSNNWIIYFYKIYDVSALFNKKLIIDNRSFILSSGEFELNAYRYESYRFHWMPLIESEDFDDFKNYCQTLSKDIEIMSLKPEYCTERGMETVFNGNYLLEIRYLETKKHQVKIETGFKKFKGLRTLLTKLNQKHSI